jgi:hypothetical protein
MMTAQGRMEEALAQQTVLDLARKFGRKAPADFSGKVDGWINERREKKTGSAGVDERVIALKDISG